MEENRQLKLIVVIMILGTEVKSMALKNFDLLSNNLVDDSIFFRISFSIFHRLCRHSDRQYFDLVNTVGVSGSHFYSVGQK